jgi:dTMP kinase
VCDRFADSSRVYQGLAGGADLDLVAALERGVVGASRPDLTLVFDLPFEVGLERALGRGAAETRFESKGPDFHARLRAGFRSIVEDNPDRCRLIDAVGDVESVAARVWAAVEPLL